MTTTTLKIEPSDDIKATTRVFIEEFYDMNLSGLRILSSLKTLIIGRLTFVNITSIREVATIKKSSRFQDSLK